jgi:hypothetical protein
MKALFVAAVLSGSVLASGQTTHTFVQERRLAFPATVVLALNVGDLTIQPAPASDRVRLEIHTNRSVDQEAMAGWVTRFDVAASRATIDVHIPKWDYNCADHGSGDVILYVPQQSDLQIDLGVGDITVRGVQGNADVRTGIGDLHIAVAQPGDYGHVEIHTRIGDIDDFLNHGGDQSGFVGKTENFTLSGRYHLRATTGIGDVHISRDGKS